MHRAAYNGQIDTMRFLLQRGASFDTINSYGEIPLFSAAAALSNSADAVSVLLDYNTESQLNMRNTRGMTPLHKSYEVGNNDATALLLENGAKTDIKDRWGRMPHHAMIPLNIWKGASQSTGVGNLNLRFSPSFGEKFY